VVILTGNGRAFSAGMDLKEGGKGWYKFRTDRKLMDIPTLLFKHFRKPIIAAINGPAIGWGLTLSLLCDIRVAAESARMSMRFTQIGLIPEAASPLLLPRIVGLANALDLSLTAKTIDAAEAYRIGLVNYLVPDDQLMDKTMEIAESIAEKSPTAIGFARRCFYDALELNFEQQQKKEKEEFVKCVTAGDFSKSQEKFVDEKKTK
jgi:2-(1,2-epoxy-1,2-dihydrophenyl)acetyl-CoA isomerase